MGTGPNGASILGILSLEVAGRAPQPCHGGIPKTKDAVLTPG